MVTTSVNVSSSFNNPPLPTTSHCDEITPLIYVACLAAYNSGRLYGAWIDATQDAGNIHQDILEMLSNSPVVGAEEWAIHAFKGFECFGISENESLESISRKANFIVQHGELGAELASYYGGNLEDTERALIEEYRGSYESELDYATSVFDDVYLDSVPEPIKSYIDYERFARDLFIGDCFSLEVQGKTHVFSRW